MCVCMFVCEHEFVNEISEIFALQQLFNLMCEHACVCECVSSPRDGH